MAARLLLTVAALALTLFVSVPPAAAAGGGAGAAGAGGGAGGRRAPAVTLVSQSWWVTPGQSFTVELGLRPGSPPTTQLEVKLALYNRLTARSTLDTTLGGTPAGGLLDVAGPAPATGSGSTLSLTVPVDNATSVPPATGPSLDLSCDPGSCQGVYPLQVTVEEVGTLHVVGRLLTYLTYDEDDLTSAAAAAGPGALRLALVLPFELPVQVDPGARAPVAALAGPTRAEVADLAAVATAVEQSGVPVTVPVTGRTVQELASSPLRDAAAARAALTALSDDPADEVPVPSYVPVDVGALAGAGLTGEIAAQVARGVAALAAAGVHDVAGTWLVDGPLGTDLASGLRRVAEAERLRASALRVVVPDADLAPVPSDPATFSQPFDLQLANGTSVRAAAADGGLTQHFGADPGDPVLAASQFLADAAFVHYERPSLVDARGLVAQPPAGWTPDPAFVAALLHGLTGNPVIEPVTLSGYFAQLAPGHNGSPATRRPLTGGSGPVIRRPVAQQVAAGRLRLSGFDSAARAPMLTQSLGDLLLASETAALSATRQLRVAGLFKRLLGAQLHQVQLSTAQTVTLTSRRASIPITVLSTAPYPVEVVLALTSDKFGFPTGGSRTMVLDHVTNSVLIPVVARTSGDLPMTVTLTSPKYGLLIAPPDEITVRSTATSVVGVALTVAAAAVLVAWWARTWRRGRRAPAASPAGDGAG